MVGNYVRKTNRQTWDEDAMQKALAAVQNKQMGWLKASKVFNVPPSTLRRRATDGNKKLKQCEKGLGRYHSTFTPEQENLLVEHIKIMEQRLSGLTCNELRRLVYEWAEVNKVIHRFNRITKRAGWDWVRAFRTRHPDIVLRKSEKNTSATDLGLFQDSDSITDYLFVKWMHHFQEFPSETSESAELGVLDEDAELGEMDEDAELGEMDEDAELGVMDEDASDKD